MRVGSEDIFLTDSGGDKPALVFVHGILADHTVWRHQVDAFSDSHRVIAVDLRGFGRSSASDPEISFEDHASDLLEVIATLGLTDVTLVGWSMGGAVSQVLAAQASDQLARLVLVDTTPQLLADAAFEHALPVEAAIELGGLLAEDWQQGCTAFCGLVAPESDAVATQLTLVASATRPDVGLAAFQSSGGRSLLDQVPHITLPTSVVCGELDAVCAPAASDYLAAAIPGCTDPVDVIAGAGHAPFLTKPAEFNDVLRRVAPATGIT